MVSLVTLTPLLQWVNKVERMTEDEVAADLEGLLLELRRIDWEPGMQLILDKVAKSYGRLAEWQGSGPEHR